MVEMMVVVVVVVVLVALTVRTWHLIEYFEVVTLSLIHI